MNKLRLLIILLVSTTASSLLAQGFDFQLNYGLKTIKIKLKSQSNFAEFALDELFFQKTDDEMVFQINGTDYPYTFKRQGCSSPPFKFSSIESRPEFLPNSYCSYDLIISGAGSVDNSFVIPKTAKFPTSYNLRISPDGNFQGESGGTIVSALALQSSGYRFQKGVYSFNAELGTPTSLTFDPTIKDMTTLPAELGIKDLVHDLNMKANEILVFRVWKEPTTPNTFATDYQYVYVTNNTLPTYSLPLVHTRLKFEHKVDHLQEYSIKFFAGNSDITPVISSLPNKGGIDDINNYIFEAWKSAHKQSVESSSKTMTALLKLHSSVLINNIKTQVLQLTLPMYIPLKFDLSKHEGTYASSGRAKLFTKGTKSDDPTKYEIRYLPLISDTTYRYLEIKAMFEDDQERYVAIFHRAKNIDIPSIQEANIVHFDDILYSNSLTKTNFAVGEFYRHRKDSNRLYYQLDPGDTIHVSILQGPNYLGDAATQIPIKKDIIAAQPIPGITNKVFASPNSPRGEYYHTHQIIRSDKAATKFYFDYNDVTLSSDNPLLLFYPQMPLYKDFRIPFRRPKTIAIDNKVEYVDNMSSGKYRAKLTLDKKLSVKDIDAKTPDEFVKDLEGTIEGPQFLRHQHITQNVKEFIQNVTPYPTLVNVFFVAYYDDFRTKREKPESATSDGKSYEKKYEQEIPGNVYYAFYYNLNTFLKIDYDLERLYVTKTDYDNITKNEGDIASLLYLKECALKENNESCLLSPSNPAIQFVPTKRLTINNTQDDYITSQKLKTGKKLLFRIKSDATRRRVKGEIDTLGFDIQRQKRPIKDRLFEIDYFNIRLQVVTSNFDPAKHILQTSPPDADGECDDLTTWSDMSVPSHGKIPINSTLCYRTKYSVADKKFSSLPDIIPYNGRWNDVFVTHIPALNPAILSGAHDYFLNLTELLDDQSYDMNYGIKSTAVGNPNPDTIIISHGASKPTIVELKNTKKIFNQAYADKKKISLYYKHSSKSNIFRSRVTTLTLDTIKFVEGMSDFNMRTRRVDTTADKNIYNRYIVKYYDKKGDPHLDMEIEPRVRHKYTVELRKKYANNPKVYIPVEVSKITTDTTYYNLFTGGESSFLFDTVERPQFLTYPETEKFVVYNPDYATKPYTYFRVKTNNTNRKDYSDKTLEAAPMTSGISPQFDIAAKKNFEFITDSITLNDDTLMSSEISTYEPPKRFGDIDFNIDLDATGDQLLIKFGTAEKGDSTTYVRVGSSTTLNTYEDFLQLNELTKLPSGTFEAPIVGQENDKFLVHDQSESQEIGSIILFVGYDYYDKAGVQKLRTNHNDAIRVRITGISKPPLNIDYEKEEATNAAAADGSATLNYKFYKVDGSTFPITKSNPKVTIQAGKDMIFRVSNGKGKITMTKDRKSPPYLYTVKADNFNNLSINIPRFDPVNAQYSTITRKSKEMLPAGTKYINVSSDKRTIDRLADNRIFPYCEDAIKNSPASEVTTLPSVQNISYVNERYYCLFVPHKDNRYFKNYFLIKVPEANAAPDIYINYFNETLALSASTNLSAYQYRIGSSGSWLPLTNRLMSISPLVNYQFRTIDNLGVISKVTSINIQREQNPFSTLVIDYGKEKFGVTPSQLPKFSIHLDQLSTSSVYKTLSRSDFSLEPRDYYLITRHKNPDGTHTNTDVLYTPTGRYRSLSHKYTFKRNENPPIAYDYSYNRTKNIIPAAHSYIFECNTAADVATFTKRSVQDIKLELNPYQICTYYTKDGGGRFKSLKDTLFAYRTPAPVVEVDHVRERLMLTQKRFDSLDILIFTETEVNGKVVINSSLASALPVAVSEKTSLHISYKVKYNNDLFKQHYDKQSQLSLVDNDKNTYLSLVQHITGIERYDIKDVLYDIDYDTETMTTTVDSLHILVTPVVVGNPTSSSSYVTLKKNTGVLNLNVHQSNHHYLWKPAYKSPTGKIFLKSKAVLLKPSRVVIPSVTTLFNIDWRNSSLRALPSFDPRILSSPPSSPITHKLSQYNSLAFQLADKSYPLDAGQYWFYENYDVSAKPKTFRSNIAEVSLWKYSHIKLTFDTINDNFIDMVAYRGVKPTSTSRKIGSVYEDNTDITPDINTTGNEPRYPKDLSPYFGTNKTYTFFQNNHTLGTDINVSYQDKPSKPDVPAGNKHSQLGPLPTNLVYSFAGNAYKPVTKYMNYVLGTYKFKSVGRLTTSDNRNYTYTPSSHDSIITIVRPPEPEMFTHFKVDSITGIYTYLKPPQGTRLESRVRGTTTWNSIKVGDQIAINSNQELDTVKLDYRFYPTAVHILTSPINQYSYHTPRFRDPKVDYQQDLITEAQNSATKYRYFVYSSSYTPIKSLYIRPNAPATKTDINLTMVSTTPLNGEFYELGITKQLTYTKSRTITPPSIEVDYEYETLNFISNNKNLVAGESQLKYNIFGSSDPFKDISMANYVLNLNDATLKFGEKASLNLSVFQTYNESKKLLNSDTTKLTYVRPNISDLKTIVTPNYAKRTMSFSRPVSVLLKDVSSSDVPTYSDFIASYDDPSSLLSVSISKKMWLFVKATKSNFKSTVKSQVVTVLPSPKPKVDFDQEKLHGDTYTEAVNQDNLSAYTGEDVVKVSYELTGQAPETKSLSDFKTSSSGKIADGIRYTFNRDRLSSATDYFLFNAKPVFINIPRITVPVLHSDYKLINDVFSVLNNTIHLKDRGKIGHDFEPVTTYAPSGIKDRDLRSVVGFNGYVIRFPYTQYTDITGTFRSNEVRVNVSKQPIPFFEFAKDTLIYNRKRTLSASDNLVIYEFNEPITSNILEKRGQICKDKLKDMRLKYNALKSTSGITLDSINTNEPGFVDGQHFIIKAHSIYCAYHLADASEGISDSDPQVIEVVKLVANVELDYATEYLKRDISLGRSYQKVKLSRTAAQVIKFPPPPTLGSTVKEELFSGPLLIDYTYYFRKPQRAIHPSIDTSLVYLTSDTVVFAPEREAKRYLKLDYATEKLTLADASTNEDLTSDINFVSGYSGKQTGPLSILPNTEYKYYYIKAVNPKKYRSMEVGFDIKRSSSTLLDNPTDLALDFIGRHININSSYGNRGHYLSVNDASTSASTRKTTSASAQTQIDIQPNDTYHLWVPEENGAKYTGKFRSPIITIGPYLKGTAPALKIDFVSEQIKQSSADFNFATDVLQEARSSSATYANVFSSSLKETPYQYRFFRKANPSTETFSSDTVTVNPIKRYAFDISIDYDKETVSPISINNHGVSQHIKISTGALVQNLQPKYRIEPNKDYRLYMPAKSTGNLTGIFASTFRNIRVTRMPRPVNISVDYDAEALNRPIKTTESLQLNTGALTSGDDTSPIPMDLGKTYRIYTNQDAKHFKSLPKEFKVDERYPIPTVNMNMEKESFLSNAGYDRFIKVDNTGAESSPQKVTSDILVQADYSYKLYKNWNARANKFKSPYRIVGPFTRYKALTIVKDLTLKTLNFSHNSADPALTNCNQIKVTRTTINKINPPSENVAANWIAATKSCEVPINVDYVYHVIRKGKYVQGTSPSNGTYKLNSSVQNIGPFTQHPIPVFTINTDKEKTKESADGTLVCSANCGLSSSWSSATNGIVIDISPALTYTFKKAATNPSTLESFTSTLGPYNRQTLPTYHIDYYNSILYFNEDDVQLFNASSTWQDLSISKNPTYPRAMKVNKTISYDFTRKFTVDKFRSLPKTIDLSAKFTTPTVEANYGFLNNEKINVTFSDLANVPDTIAVKVNNEPWISVFMPGPATFAYDISGILNRMPVENSFQFSVRSLGSNPKSKFASDITTIQVNTRQSKPKEGAHFLIDYTYEDISPLVDSIYIQSDKNKIESGDYVKLKALKHNSPLVGPGQSLYVVKPNTPTRYASLPEELKFPARQAAPNYKIDYFKEEIVFQHKGILFSQKILHDDLLVRGHGQAEDVDYYYTMNSTVVKNTDTIQLLHPSYGGRFNPTKTPYILYYSTIANQANKTFRSSVGAISLSRPDGVEFKLDFNTEEILAKDPTFNSQYQYSFDRRYVDPKVVIHSSSSPLNITDTIDKFNQRKDYNLRAFDVYLRLPATRTQFASVPYILPIPQRQSAPSLLINYAKESIYTSNDGEILMLSDDKDFQKRIKTAKKMEGDEILLGSDQIYNVPDCDQKPLRLYGALKPSGGFLASKRAPIIVPPRNRPDYFQVDYLAEKTVQKIPNDVHYSIGKDNTSYDQQATDDRIDIVPGTQIHYYQASGSSRFKSCEQHVTIKPRRVPFYGVNYLAERLINLDGAFTSIDYRLSKKGKWLPSFTTKLLGVLPGEQFSVVYKPIIHQEFLSDTTRIDVDPRPDLSYIRPDFPNLLTNVELSTLILISYFPDFAKPFSFAKPTKLELKSQRDFWLFQLATRKSFKSDIYEFIMPVREFRNISVYHEYDYDKEQVTYEPRPKGVYEYSYTADFHQRFDVDGPINITPGGELYYRVKGSDKAFPTFPVLFEVKPRPKTTDINIDFNYRSGVIGTTLSNNMEYAFTDKCDQKPKEFKAGDGTPFEKLNAGRCIHIRKNFTRSDFRSESKAFVIPERIEDDMNVSINYFFERTNEVISPDMEYATSKEFLVYDEGGNTLLPIYPNDTLYFRHKRFGKVMPSSPYKLVIPKRPESPKLGIDYLEEKTKDVLTNEMSYSYQVDGNFKLFHGKGAKLELEDGRTYLVWYKATNEQFKSKIDSFRIPKRPHIELQRNPTGIYTETTLMLNLYDNDVSEDITIEDFDTKHLEIIGLEKLSDSLYKISTKTQSTLNISNISLRGNQEKGRYRSTVVSVPTAGNPLIVWPNPTSGVVNIQSQVILVQIRVFNMQGEIVRRFHNNLHSIDISELNRGQYIIVGYDLEGNNYTEIINKVR